MTDKQMNKTTAALKLAEEALYAELESDTCEEFAEAAEKCHKALAAIREALAEQDKQEPVAWLNPHNQAVIDVRKKKQIGEGKGYPNFSIPLYAAPVERQWVELTDDEMWDVFINKDWTGEPLQLMSAVIAAFKEKNT